MPLLMISAMASNLLSESDPSNCFILDLVHNRTWLFPLSGFRAVSLMPCMEE